MLTAMPYLLKTELNKPDVTTACVWTDVPDAIFVSAHAASNCNGGLQPTYGTVFDNNITTACGVCYNQKHV